MKFNKPIKKQLWDTAHQNLVIYYNITENSELKFIIGNNQLIKQLDINLYTQTYIQLNNNLRDSLRRFS